MAQAYLPGLAGEALCDDASAARRSRRLGLVGPQGAAAGNSSAAPESSWASEVSEASQISEASQVRHSAAAELGVLAIAAGVGAGPARKPAAGPRDPQVAEDVAAVLERVPDRLAGGGRRVRRTVDRDSLPEEADVMHRPVLSEALRGLWDVSVLESILLSWRLRALSRLWDGDEEAPFPDPDGDIHALAAAAGLRVPTGRADHAIRDASRAVSTLSACLSLLEEGIFPAPWFTHLLRRSRHLSDVSRRAMDEVVAGWNLSMTPESFFTRTSALAAWLEEAERLVREEQPPVRRDVHLAATDQGMARLEVFGPAPEVLQCAHRLDVAARAVQAAQKSALAAGSEIPWDVDGSVSASGKPSRLDALRFLLLTRSALDTDGADVPAERFRINLTVPALTLLGVVDAPGMLDGTMPVPADLARELAAGESTWYRVLTDPRSGAFLPLPADAYRPTRAMQEHLRLRGGVCAVPGCERPVRAAVECDHIQEWLSGGMTSTENLHWLCRFHHREKTEGRIDPVRLHGPRREPDGTRAPGRTRWRIRTIHGDEAVLDVEDQTDLVGTLAVDLLSDHYRNHLRDLCDADCRHFGRNLPPSRPDHDDDPDPDDPDPSRPRPGVPRAIRRRREMRARRDGPGTAPPDVPDPDPGSYGDPPF
ncbi:HNH endonuclease signature motif containing protein [Brachybacterium hainanense]|uniref:HNH endonuclease signature motif containing protein n=1 Tax=Brachybacterium hainanense TaxID=1541174 RepID=A0ABV6R7I3_9MICO